jgi:hypothetical protein
MLAASDRFSFRWVVAAISGFGLSLGACYWLTTLPRAERSTLAARSGYVCAFCCALGVGILCWGVILGYVGRRRKWSPKACRLAGLTFLLPLVLIFGAHGYYMQVMACAGLWMSVGSVCQKLVYPHAASDELYAVEPPLTLFPK